MSDIKIKERESKSIKICNKLELWTERIKNPIVYSNEKIDNQDSQLDYGVDKINYVTNRMKDEIIHSTNRTRKRMDNVINKLFNRKKIIKIKQNINFPVDSVKNSEKLAQETLKKSKSILRKSKKVFNGTKSVINTIVSTIKNAIKSLKSLITFLLAGGWIAVLIIVIICLIGLLVSSIYGIFFSSNNIDGNVKMSAYIQELNAEMDTMINQIEISNPHDEVIINSNKAEWKDILSVYAVRVSNGNNQQDVMILDENKKKILKEVYFDMNTISYELKNEKYKSLSIGSLVENKTLNSDIINKSVLHINIDNVNMDFIKAKYNFSDLQLKQLDELLDDKNNDLWSAVIYGTYSSSEEIDEWKQNGKEWSNIKIGNTNYTIGEIGCLVTSISILIEKSGVSTNGIYPFNPGTFVTALNNNYGFDSSGNLYYSAISKVVPDFIYQGHVNLRDKSKSVKFNEIKKYFEKGYFITIEVKGATPNSQHWVVLDNISNNTIFMLDPASNEIDLWKKYDWNNTSQFVYFKKY